MWLISVLAHAEAEGIEIMRTHAVLVTAVLVVATVDTPAQSIVGSAQAWGPAEHGLRLGIAPITEKPPSSAGEFEVTLENSSDADFVVNLGMMLSNGKVMFPSAIHLLLVDSAGTTRQLEFSDRRYPGVAGRVDDFTVAMRAGSRYALRLSLSQDFWSPATKEFTLNLTDGRYQLSARFDGQGARSGNLDMQGVALLNFWRGTVQSDAIQFEVSKAAVVTR